MKRVLCHGDSWSTNLIWRKRDDGMQLASVIDFQLKQGYGLSFPFDACVIVSTIAPLFELANNSDDVEYKERVIS
ncbi:hypothetical protein ANCDUO_11119, partial [Ancylostoma duodenale]